MAEQPPQKHVVKKVVKRPTTRPGGSGTTSTSTSPAKPKAVAASRPGVAKRPAATRPSPSAPAREKAAEPRPSRPTISVKVPAVGAAVRHGAGRTGRAVGSGLTTIGDVVVLRWDAVRSWRVPHVHPVRAAALAGLVAGLLTTLLGYLSTLFFSAVRGVSTGGGFYGTITVIVLVALVALVATRLLAAMGVQQAATVTVLGLTTSVVVVLAFFLDPVAGVWAWLILPLTGALTFVVGQRLVALAERPDEA